MKCDACGEIFCSEHFSYRTHSCPSAYQRDVQVPICPLCSEPVPTPRDVSPDVTVGAHIDQFCKLEKPKIFTNRCTFKNCKKKELIPFSCGVCKQNYCLKHRHMADHECKRSATAGGDSGTAQRTKAVSASLQWQQQEQQEQSSRTVPQQQRSNTSQLVAAVQGSMSEDEALARALALSMQEEEDERARATREGEPTNGRNPARSRIPVGGNSSKDKCNLS
ncbi:AN1-type zinc finger protein 2A isoform X2 [Ochlerotatus camptorhynchus]